MGLDNGIVIRFRKSDNKYIKERIAYMQEWLGDYIPEDSINPEEIEICYWRKYWHLRNDIVTYLEKAKPDNDWSEFGGGDCLLTKEDIWQIRKICIEYLTSGDKASSIWTRAEEGSKLGRDIVALGDLYNAICYDGSDIKEYFEVEFYDSY